MENIKETMKEVFDEELPDMVRVITKEEIDKTLAKKEVGKAKPVEKPEEKDVKKFFRAVFDRDNITAKALSEGTDASGGYLVPEEFLGRVLDIQTEYGFARKYGSEITMSRDTVKLPKIDSKPDVQWLGEAESITANEPSFGQVPLIAKKAGIIVPITNELLNDSAVDIEAILARMFAEQFAAGEDIQALTGTGAVFTGILNVAGTNVVSMATGDTSFSNITADHLIDLITAVPSAVVGKSYFILNKAIWATIKRLTDGSGNYLFSPADKTIWGYPVILSDVMPDFNDDAAETPFVIFGDPSWLYFGDRKALSIKIADQATVGSTNLYEKDMVALRAIERVGEVVTMPNAFAILKTGTVA